MKAEVEAMLPPFIYSLNPLEPQLPSSTRTMNPMPLRSSFKSISKPIVLPFPCRLRLLSTTRLCLDSKHLARRTLNYAGTSLIPLELVRRIDTHGTVGLTRQDEPVPIRLQITYIASI
jgi:hypothetical protein